MIAGKLDGVEIYGQLIGGEVEVEVGEIVCTRKMMTVSTERNLCSSFVISETVLSIAVNSRAR